MLQPLQPSPGIPPDPPRDRPHLQPVKTSQCGQPARAAGRGQKATAANLRWKFGKAKRHHLDNEVGTRSPLAWRQSKQAAVTISKLHQTLVHSVWNVLSLPIASCCICDHGKLSYFDYSPRNASSAKHMQKHNFTNCCICDHGKLAQIIQITCGEMHHQLNTSAKMLTLLFTIKQIKTTMALLISLRQDMVPGL